MAARVDLNHAQREATSLKRFAEANGQDDLAEFAALVLQLVAQVRGELSDNALREITRVRAENAELRRQLTDTQGELRAAYAKLRARDDENPDTDRTRGMP